MKAWCTRAGDKEPPDNEVDDWREYPTCDHDGRAHDGHIIPLDSDEGIQELLDAHPEFHSRAERRLAQGLADNERLSYPEGTDFYGLRSCHAETWLAWANEGK